MKPIGRLQAGIIRSINYMAAILDFRISQLETLVDFNFTRLLLFINNENGH